MYTLLSDKAGVFLHCIGLNACSLQFFIARRMLSCSVIVLHQCNKHIDIVFNIDNMPLFTYGIQFTTQLNTFN